MAFYIVARAYAEKGEKDWIKEEGRKEIWKCVCRYCKNLMKELAKNILMSIFLPLCQNFLWCGSRKIFAKEIFFWKHFWASILSSDLIFHFPSSFSHEYSKHLITLSARFSSLNDNYVLMKAYTCEGKKQRGKENEKSATVNETFSAGNLPWVLWLLLSERLEVFFWHFMILPCHNNRCSF